ncbi:hypothetical protein [Leptospira sp. id769339]|uniref:hypothetical protein n=1 Tax=Leptospira sp. id769339 TaxID=2864221 RepID=UPI00214CFE40|nr:hypothetical protein [Leptospira sp. id769339]MCR1795691.1 hypothetical protein [Leptospira sp. id769339]
MKANVFSHTQLIGTANLEVCDESMGCICGEFYPTDIYLGEIQTYAISIQETGKLNDEKWNSFRINIQLENGYFIPSSVGVLIQDFDKSLSSPKTIDIVRLDRHIFEDFFKNQTSIDFVIPPWYSISIEQKIAFEDELFKELGEKSKIPFLSKLFPSKHVLSEFEVSALCKDARSDDVLFMVRNKKSDMEFAVVHLTWLGKKEQTGFPRTEFYKDFNHFRTERNGF